ncbi:MAG: RagB/SusD family nutrient uptake outer membrane protein [Tannerellaceae bacterium]|nr:RagB/SusD family nutrient uptake outer membrane protein [Tannerellaceae bacterium]
MKRINYFIVLFVFLALGTSCNDDFLERSPLDKISDANYWKTTNDLKLYVNNLYSRNDLLAREDGWGSIGPYGWDADQGSDTQVKYTYNTRMNGEETIPDDGSGSGTSGWGTGQWEALRDINYFLDHYQLVEELTSFDDVKQYVGETLFFRSIFYFYKLRMYGDLPWCSTTVTTSSDILYGPRLPRNQIVDFIMADLDNAIDYLPAFAGWTGRVTKETAMALQARIALYEGTWEKYHANDPFKAAENQSTKFLEKAAKVAGDLIAMSEANGYPGLDGVGNEFGYRDLFNQEDYSASNEVMFWRKYDVGAITSIWDRYSANGSGRGITKNLVDSYLKADGTPVELNYNDATLVKIAENRDPRLSQTIQINDKKHYRWEKASPSVYFIAPAFDGWDSEESCPSGYQVYKGHNFRYAEARPNGQGLQALIYFRFGETLLLYAEAKAELGTLTQTDLDRSINKLRDRVGMSHMTLNVKNDPNFEFASLPPVIQEIRRERKVELACEGFRVDDIMRWAAAGELIAGKIPVGAKIAQFQNFKFEDYLPEAAPDLSRQSTFEERVSALETDANGYVKIFKNTLNGGTQGFKFNVNRDYLYPIPTNQLTLNPQLKQNPGWE